MAQPDPMETHRLLERIAVSLEQISKTLREVALSQKSKQ
jgi:hypothetical protein